MPSCLNETHWHNLYEFAKLGAHADFLFGVSFDLEVACAEHEKYEWDASNIKDWLENVVLPANDTLWGFELGNEINNQGNAVLNNSCGNTPKQQAQAFATLADALAELYPSREARPVLLGPDTGYLDSPTWMQQFLVAAKRLGVRLFGVTNHNYNQIDLATFDSLDLLADADVAWMPPLVDEYAPGSQIWAGEVGPHTGGENGTCGSDADSVCGTFASALWYASDLGQRAAAGFAQHQRQDLVGGRYALLDIQRGQESLGTHATVVLYPDFWVNWMWKRVMGTAVLRADLSDDFGGTLMAYAHRGVPPSPWAEPRGSGGAAALGLVIVNLDETEARSVSVAALVGEDRQYSQWTLSPGPDGYASSEATMNGEALATRIADGSVLGEMSCVGNPVVGHGTAALVVPPVSVVFVVV